jgi:hypothetical protein
MQFLVHDSFINELKRIAKKHPDIAELKAVKRLLCAYFENGNTDAIAPGKIHKVTVADSFVIWKIEVHVTGIRPNLWPRLWFAVKDNIIAFLAIATHADNYSNNDLDAIATERAIFLMSPK